MCPVDGRSMYAALRPGFVLFVFGSTCSITHPLVLRHVLILLQSAGGAIAHHLAEQLTALSSSGEARRTPLQNLSANATAELTNRLAEGIAMFKQDLDNIKSGHYKLPWDMTTLSHRQYNPLFILRR